MPALQQDWASPILENPGTDLDVECVDAQVGFSLSSTYQTMVNACMLNITAPEQLKYALRHSRIHNLILTKRCDFQGLLFPPGFLCNRTSFLTLKVPFHPEQ